MIKVISVFVFSLLVVGTLFGGGAVYAQTEQDDCAPGYVVNSTGTGCIEANLQNDPNNCYAQGGGSDAIERCLAASSRPCELTNSYLGIPTWYKYLDAETDSSGRCNVILSSEDCSQDPSSDIYSQDCVERNTNSVLPIGIAILEGILRLSGLVAVVMVFWGGFKYITSQGNPDSAKGAKSTVINAMIGLVIVILSSAIVSFIGRSIS